MKRHVPNNARVLLYDIETAPNLAYVWGKYEQDVISYEKQWYMLSFAYKWLGEKRTHVKALPDFKSYKKGSSDDKQLVTALHALFDEADVIIAHNGNSFDQKKSNARFVVHGLAPPTPYRQIDTRLVARRYFKFNSNKLDDLGQLLGVGKKLSTGGFDLWLGCMNGVKKSWDTMKSYNKQDVELLEEVYYKLLPWIGNHPAMNLLEGISNGCPYCTSTDLKKNGYYSNKVNKVQVWHCNNCGANPRSRYAERLSDPVEFIT